MIAHVAWRPGGRSPWAALVALAAMYLGLQYWLWTNDTVYLRGHWMLAVWVPALAALLALGVHVVVQAGVLAAALGRRPLVWLGEVSFCVYLWHDPVLKLLGLLAPELRTSKGGSLLALAACLALTLPLAALSFRLVESPAMGGGGRPGAGLPWLRWARGDSH